MKIYHIFRVYYDKNKKSEYVRIAKGIRRATHLIKYLNYDEFHDKKYFYIMKEAIPC